MNGNYLFNQIIAQQRIQERLREAEAQRRVAQARRADDVEQVAEPDHRWLRRWLRLPAVHFHWQWPNANRSGG